MSTERAALTKSTEPMPRYAAFCFVPLLRCSIRIAVHSVLRHRARNPSSKGRISFARFMSAPGGKNACMGSSTTAFASASRISRSIASKEPMFGNERGASTRRATHPHRSRR